MTWHGRGVSALSWQVASFARAPNAYCIAGAKLLVAAAPGASAAMESEPQTLSSLPHALVGRILLLLPVDQRARCATVCRGWHKLLADCSLWTRLDLSDESGVTCTVGEKALRCAAARAGGALQALDLRRQGKQGKRGRRVVPFRVVVDVATSNSGTLHELCIGHAQGYDLEKLLRVAPKLKELWAEVYCKALAVEEAPRMLRNEPPYGPLRASCLVLHWPDKTAAGSARVGAVLVELGGALFAHASLRSLRIIGELAVWNQAGCNVLMDGAVFAQLPSLELRNTRFSSASTRALVCMLSGRTLTRLVLSNCTGLLDIPARCAMLAMALWEHTALICLELAQMPLWSRFEAHVPGVMLLDMLKGHPSLQTLACRCDWTSRAEGLDAVAVGAALGDFVAANAPALRVLDLSDNFLDESTLAPLCEALPLNTHLHSLDVSDNFLDEAFVARHLLPAVRANTSLRTVNASLRQPEGFKAPSPSVVAMMQLMDARTEAAGA